MGKFYYLKETLKREIVDFSRCCLGKKTAIDKIFDDLATHHLIPKKITALDLFSRNGLWVTKDYANKTTYIELFEIDPYYYNWSKKVIKANYYHLGDTIKILQNKQTQLDNYNFIYSDNILGLYGDYCEHFEIFDLMFNYITNGILMFNIVNNTNIIKKDTLLSDKKYNKWIEKRLQFYGNQITNIEEPNIVELQRFYTSKIENKNFIINYTNHIVRTKYVTIIYFSISK